jgi:hypothetical protein
MLIGAQTEAWTYFGMAVGICVVTLVLFIFMMRTQFAKFHIAHYEEETVSRPNLRHYINSLLEALAEAYRVKGWKESVLLLGHSEEDLGGRG